ncbi:MAG: hypothetical protein KKG69_11705 [Alphaproteobacteria bacterium]|jgi:hypothetical protein|uniref:DUF2975 domain-containing protein n=1 Tax=Brevundimonas mediterranea TaxID=74329 RepID=A0AB37E674_9CAUL|nr:MULTISPECIES: hypothetical protein [Brevundimonas]MBU1270567.1 hypothetical protein [Alphaproteobacteria bacterium]MDZ4373868.1 hypothetical protein [Phenylobacterium sp.]OGN45558.1 MAG: hypothetical protein A3E24_03210 [Caulobacterales bacterium RIFCSPHIGHO2_12_FULL_68_13]OGN48674.1 MAG: hypothetical protein A2795_04885 [Caulobacterales bacterium RIFCSPHIGHO2_01_FULL_67_30]OYX79971.1 MAG: hypothetical protein B7Y85_07025 [Brevundimonas sp. 32-68-21]
MRKIHLWISLVVGVLVWGAYFLHFAQGLRSGDLGGLIWWFLAALIVAVVAEGAATGLIARLLRRRTRALDDGPTLQAALKAGHVALMLLVGLILLSALVLALSSVFGWTLDLSGARGQVIAANLLLGMAVVAELVRAGLTLALTPRR